MKELKIAYFTKSKGIPEGFYAFTKPNLWHPVVYFRKPKNTSTKEYKSVVEKLKSL